MSRAQRLYLYVVSGVGLAMWAAAAIIALRLFLNEIGLGQQISGSYARDLNREMWSLAIALGAVGLALWAYHWLAVERAVRPSEGPAGEASAGERRSIIRSFYLASVMASALPVAAMLAIQTFGRTLADLVKSTEPSRPGFGDFDSLGGIGIPQAPSMPSATDDWSVAAIIVLLGVWAYHAWIRNRDVRQGPVITGAAAWVSRLYLYWAAYIGLTAVIQGVAAIVTTITNEWWPTKWQNDDFFSSYSVASDWERQVILSLVAIGVWAAVWLAHWLYSVRLRNGASAQSADEKTSRVRLAFMVGIVVYGATAVLSGVASSLSLIVGKTLETKMYEGRPELYYLVTPLAGAVAAALAWWWHHRRAMAEDADGPVGVSAARVLGYAVAAIGLVALTVGLASNLNAIFLEWFDGDRYSGYSLWKLTVASSGPIAALGLLFWAVPWLFAQTRRGPQAEARQLEIDSSSRAWYLHSAVGIAIIVIGVAVAQIGYQYLRATFGLHVDNIGREISVSLAFLAVAALVYVYHRLVLTSDRTPPAPPAAPPAA